MEVLFFWNSDHPLRSSQCTEERRDGTVPERANKDTGQGKHEAQSELTAEDLGEISAGTEVSETDTTLSQLTADDSGSPEGKNDFRFIKSRAGHRLTLDDSDGSET